MNQYNDYEQDFESAKKMDFTFIGQGCKLFGQFVFLGPTFIASSLEGEISMDGTAPLRIEKMGEIKGVIRGHDIDIFGKLEGKIISSGKVTIRSTALIKGEIHCKNLVIHPGANIELEAHSKNSLQ